MRRRATLVVTDEEAITLSAFMVTYEHSRGVDKTRGTFKGIKGNGEATKRKAGSTCGHLCQAVCSHTQKTRDKGARIEWRGGEDAHGTRGGRVRMERRRGPGCARHGRRRGEDDNALVVTDEDAELGLDIGLEKGEEGENNGAPEDLCPPAHRKDEQSPSYLTHPRPSLLYTNSPLLQKAYGAKHM